MPLNAEKRRQLAEVALQRKDALGPSDADAATPIASALGPSAPAPIDHRQKGVVEATASEDEDTCRPCLQEEEESRCRDAYDFSVG